MEWNKCTPHTMPTNTEPVLATILAQHKLFPTHKCVSGDVYYDAEDGVWYYAKTDTPLPLYFTVTHWMPLPDPADD